MNRNRGICRRIAAFSLRCVPAAVLIVILCYTWFGGRKEEPPIEPAMSEGSEEDGKMDSGKVDEREESTEDNSSREEATIYEPSEYDFKLDEITVEIEDLTRGYDIAFVNDLHLIADSEPGDVLEENLPAVMERYHTLSVTPEGVHAQDLWTEIVTFLNYYNFDAIIFGGDMIDYYSQQNMEALTQGFDDLKYPREQIMYLRSNHDYSGGYSGDVFTDTDGHAAQAKLWDGDEGKCCIEFYDFIIVGVNGSHQNLSDEGLSFLKEKLELGKPVIVATHVPFYSEEDGSLEEKAIEVRGRINYWNKENASYNPDQNTQAFIDCMYGTDSNVIQIVAAHLHASWDGIAANEVREHIFAPSFEGRIGIIHVVPGNG